MKNAIITVAMAVTGFAVVGLVGHLINRHSGKCTGGSFRESLKDNSDSADFFLDESKGGES